MQSHIQRGGCCIFPTGAFFCGARDERARHALQAAYKQELSESYGVAFDNLLCLNNMPIKRYVDYLQRRGQLEEYMQVLLLPSYILCSDTSHGCTSQLLVMGFDRYARGKLFSPTSPLPRL